MTIPRVLTMAPALKTGVEGLLVLVTDFTREIRAKLVSTDAVLSSTHNLRFELKYEKNVCPCKATFIYVTLGYNGLFISWTCFVMTLYMHTYKTLKMHCYVSACDSKQR